MNDIVKPRELHGYRLFGYSIGNFGIFLTRLLITVFAFQFYVYTINLDSIFVSIGLSMNLIVDATTSIIFGVITDNKKSGKYGKRRPFLFYLLPIWFFTSIFIWIPPWYCPKNNSFYWPTALFFWTMLLFNAISGASIISAQISMLPEQSHTYKNREKVAAWRAIFMIVASVISLMLPLIVQSMLSDPENVKWWEPSGKVILFYLPIIGGSFAIFGLISIILTFFSVDESFHKFTPFQKKNLTILASFQQMAVPAKDKKFKKFLGVAFFNSIAGRLFGILIIPFLAFALKFKGPEFLIYVLVSITCKFGWFFVWRKILENHPIIKTYSLCILSAFIAALLELIFLVELLSFELKLTLFVITVGTILGAIYGLNLFNVPVASAIIYEAAVRKNDENLEKGVSNISGSYFGLYSFIMAVGQACATILVGIVLSGPNEKNPTIITITISSMSIFYFISMLILRRIEIIKVESKQLVMKERTLKL